MSTDPKATVFLPKTDFPMRAGLPEREPKILAYWDQIDLYGKMRDAAVAENRTPFILHDGPPYANGNIHIGHALNKILKDVVNRAKHMQGYGIAYVPGWDCHGLPIEWKIEEKYRAAGKKKEDVPVMEMRKDCRDFADHWIGVQRAEFQRLGVVGAWDRPYTTMTPHAESRITGEIHKFLLNGGLYRGAKPVMWSVVEQTALAEAEVEYHDHTSSTIWLRFPIVQPSKPELAGAALVIWTTTPWTIPGNRAVAYGEEIDYGVYEVTARADDARVIIGDRLVVATALAESVQKEAKITGWTQLATLKGKDLAGTIAAHPLRGQGYDFDIPALPGNFVTTETGTGLVHIAPGHGADDFLLGQANGLPVPETVDPAGRYYDHVPLFAGRSVYTPQGKTGDANRAVIEALAATGELIAMGKLVHSYPHSWRSKAPLIFRTTPQWFISMAKNDLRDRALHAIDQTRWLPAEGRNRIHAMIAGRPDWCISRQRAWGVPIALFVNKKTGEPLRDETVCKRITDIFAKEGSDAWYTRPARDFLGNEYTPEDYEQVKDIVDVWFESGATHAFVCEQPSPWPELTWPASLYLEGSDQHRGWFHSSLLVGCGTRGRAPYDAVFTHGFVLDGEGRKMSKSMGNVVAPQDVIKDNGADILRLWVCSADYHEDARIGPEILKFQADTYRRVRNTLRYLLGALDGFTDAEKLDHDEMPSLERYILHRLKELEGEVADAIDSFDFHRLFMTVHNFCANELSAFYFDIRKDSLYCDRPDSLRRRACRTVFDVAFDCITAWLAPILCFTTEEAWHQRHGDGSGSVHLRRFPTLPDAWRDEGLSTRWAGVRAVRAVVTGALEVERAAKRIGSSLQAAPKLFITPSQQAAIAGLDMAEICITSALALTVGAAPDGAFTLAEVEGAGVIAALAEGGKCARCWQIKPEVAGDAGLCNRCQDAVAAYPVAAE